MKRGHGYRIGTAAILGVLLLATVALGGCGQSAADAYQQEIEALNLDTRIVELFESYESIYGAFGEEMTAAELQASREEVDVWQAEFDELVAEVRAVDSADAEVAAAHQHLVEGLEYMGQATQETYRFFDLMEELIEIETAIDEGQATDDMMDRLNIIMEDTMDIVFEVSRLIAEFEQSLDQWDRSLQEL